MSKMNLSFLAGVEYCGKIYASAREVNGLFQVDLVTKEISYKKIFLKEKTDWAIYRMAFLYKNEAWFIPGRGKYITVVNLDTLNIDYFEVPFKWINKEALAQNKSVYSSGGMIDQKFLYLIPANIDTLLVIDLERKKLYPYYDVANPEEILQVGVCVKESIYMLSERKNNMIKINLRTKAMERYSCPWSCKAYAGIVHHDTELWCVSCYGDYIFSIDLDTQKIKEILLERDFYEKFMYHELIIEEDELFLLPRADCKILKINMDTMETKVLYFETGLTRNRNVALRKLSSSNTIIMDCFANNSILVYDKIKGVFQEFKLSIEKEILLKKMKEENISLNIERLRCNGNYKEGLLGIEDFVEKIVNLREQKKDIQWNVGKNIWSEVENIP